MNGASAAIKRIWQRGRRQVLTGFAVALGVFTWLFPKHFTDPSETREVVVAIVAGAFAIYLGARTACRLWPDRGIVASDRWLGKFLVRRPKGREVAGVAAEVPRRTAVPVLPLANVDMREASLPGANLVAADLKGATLRGADLTGASLQGTDLRDADLSRSDLSFAGLSRTSLTGANLSGARLDGADLTGADLRTANLRGASLRGTLYDDATLWPPQFKGQPPVDAENVDLLRR